MKTKTHLKAGYDIPAGPIWSNDMASAVCPGVCSDFEGWNEEWKTTIPNKQSVCGCNVDAGLVCQPG